MENMQWLLDASTWIIPVITAIILHEVAHGYAALYFGDTTAKRMGRLTLNPLVHVDRVGTVILPALLVLMKSPVVFGYAKPVPVDFNNLSPLRLGTICVALAGPFTNLLLAIMAGFMLHIDYFITLEQAPWLFKNIVNMMLINLVLMVFNMIPILPLDGGRVLTALLSKKPHIWFDKLDTKGMAIVLLLLFVPSILGYNFINIIVGIPTFWILENLLWLTGNA
ncbi:MAG: site-2 protease family protein [Pseudomonadota bacterium]